MKLTLFLAALGVTSAELLQSPHHVPLNVGQELAELLSARNGDRTLDEVCNRLENVGEDLFKQTYGFGFNCNCDSGSLYTLVCNSKNTQCCGDVCGGIQQTLRFTSSGSPIDEQACISYTSGVALAGKSYCVLTEYDSFGEPVSCSSAINGDACNACSVCGQLPGAPMGVFYVTSDCNNLPGGDTVSNECGDLDTYEELLEMSLQCKGSGAMSNNAAYLITAVAGLLVMLV